eukprot:CAMPEP_0185787854 /NCGR_PEP_ID=MMETSP1174-20130828/143108_1 /TAXON_ID=35687 /ORGANISM="Dictyocha speculum, Strain CCMP1381" /LENGTH=64 /DNA_ID=CAMNT_0028481231 /DNA_START=95 /DNA_END=285 /DNA_ORIENTATION=-
MTSGSASGEMPIVSGPGKNMAAGQSAVQKRMTGKQFHLWPRNTKFAVDSNGGQPVVVFVMKATT